MSFYENTLKKEKRVDPRSILISGPVKTGKTTTLAQLPGKAIHIDIGVDKGSDFLDNFHTIHTNWKGGKDIMAYNELKKNILNECKESGKKFDFITLDTISEMIEGVDSIANQLALIAHNKTISSASKKKSEDYDIRDYGNGYGWPKLQDAVIKELTWWGKLTHHLILVAHIKRKDLDKTADTLTSIDAIDLPGKLANMVAGGVSSVGFMYKQGDECFISFKKSYKNSEMGSRSPHLDGQDILISKKLESGEIETYWNKIFINL